MAHFHRKYLVSWYIIGAAFGIAIAIPLLMEEGFQALGLGLVSVAFFGPLIMIIFGGIGLFFALWGSKWKFDEVSNPTWIWYIFPVYTIIMLPIALVIGIIRSS